jgi:phasin family protein
MTDLNQHKPGGKSDRRKQKRNKKAAQQQGRAPEQAQAAPEPIETAMASAEPVESTVALTPVETTPAEPVATAPAETRVAVAPVAPAAADTAPAEPVARVASFRERMAAAMPSADTAPTKPAAPADVAQAAASPAAAPATGIQAIANAYRDYTKQSLEDAQSFAEKLTAARSLDKAVEAQTEFARQACETFADNSRKIRELHRELFWQAFRLPNWPGGRRTG